MKLIKLYIITIVFVCTACSKTYQSSSEIVEDIEHSMHTNPKLGYLAHDVRYQVQNGEVIVYGTVNSSEVEFEVIDTLENIPGVNQVINELEIIKPEELASMEIGERS